MAKIKNIEMLRDHALEMLEKLANSEIDVSQAGVSGKLCESVISTIKSQLQYCQMTDQQPDIPFMQVSGSGRLLEGETSKNKALGYSKTNSK